MNIHEYQAKGIFKKYGIPTNPGRFATTPDEVYEAAKALYKPGEIIATKAQVHAGARGKGGGIKIAKNPEESKAFAQKILGTNLVTPQTGPEGKPVNSIWLESSVGIKKEFYVGIVLDRGACKPSMIVSNAGGMDIEEVAEKHPEKMIRQLFSVEKGMTPAEAAELAAKVETDDNIKTQLASVFSKLSMIFIENDVSLIEINPLAVMDDGLLIAIDAKINFDDNALFRHPEIAAMYDPSQDDAREVEAKKFDLSYVGLDGEIGCVVNGAGLAMATMDIIKYEGAEPANFLDVGGGASQEKVAAAFNILLSDKRVKAILINIFGGIMRCDVLANGILQAVQSLSPERRKQLDNTPIVVRLEGTNAKEGREILAKSNIKLFSVSDFKEAAEKVVAELKK